MYQNVFINNHSPVGIICSYTPNAQHIINQRPFRCANVAMHYDHGLVYVRNRSWRELKTTRIWDLDEVYGAEGTTTHMVGTGVEILNDLFDDYVSELSYTKENL